LKKKKKMFRRPADPALDVSIGTQSLMHPVDWLEINKRNGVQQVLPEVNETTWFDAGDLSLLQTPQDRKSYPRHSLLQAEGQDDPDSGYVIHSVETDLVFSIHVPMSTKRAVLSQSAQENKAPEGSETPWIGDDEPVPFSTIKKESGSYLSRSLTRSKRSLFAVDMPREAVDDGESDEDSLDI
jgi:hypothetical protein